MGTPGDKEYIGDGVYAEFDSWGALILTTEDGVSVQNRIVLELREWEKVKDKADRFWFQQRKGTEHGHI